MTLAGYPSLPRTEKAKRAVLSLDMAAYHAVHDYRDPQGNIGVPAVARHYSWNPRTLQNKLNPNEDRNHLTARELEFVAALTLDTRLLDAFCTPLRALWMPMPEVSGLSGVAILNQIGEASAQLGQLARDTCTALADGRISADELAVLEKTSMRLMQAVQLLLQQARADMSAGGHG